MNNLIQFDSAKSGPLYVNLADAIIQAIHQGRLHDGDALPPQREMAEQLNVSVITVRKALEQLVTQGLVCKKHGAGTFIQSSPKSALRKPLAVLNGFSEDIRARGMSPETRILSAGISIASAEEIIALGLKPGDKVSRLERLLLADGEPLAVDCSVFPLDVLPRPELVRGSVYQQLQQSNLQPVRALQTITARNASADIAAKLGIAPHDALLYIERRGLLANNRVVEFTTSLYRGDKYDFVTEITTGSAA